MRKTSLIILSLFSSGLLQQGAGYKVAVGIRFPERGAGTTLLSTARSTGSTFRAIRPP
jgi:hypothetical protein